MTADSRHSFSPYNLLSHPLCDEVSRERERVYCTNKIWHLGARSQRNLVPRHVQQTHVHVHVHMYSATYSTYMRARGPPRGLSHLTWRVSPAHTHLSTTTSHLRATCRPTHPVQPLERRAGEELVLPKPLAVAVGAGQLVVRVVLPCQLGAAAVRQCDALRLREAAGCHIDYLRARRARVS